MPGRSTRRHLDVVFVVDCSGSMAGERIGALNWAARTVVPTMRAQAEEHPDVVLRIRVLRFATGAAFVSEEPVPIERFAWTTLEAAGESDLGAAFRLLAETVSAVPVDDAPPAIVLLTDGFPSDDATAGLGALLATEAGRRAVRIPIAIGPDADMDLLRAFSSDPGTAPLRSHEVEMLVGRMQWVASAPLRARLAAAGADGETGEDRDLW